MYDVVTPLIDMTRVVFVETPDSTPKKRPRGRPRKYHTKEEVLRAAAQRSREYRQRKQAKLKEKLARLELLESAIRAVAPQ